MQKIVEDSLAAKGVKMSAREGIKATDADGKAFDAAIRRKAGTPWGIALCASSPPR